MSDLWEYADHAVVNQMRRMRVTLEISAQYDKDDLYRDAQQFWRITKVRNYNLLWIQQNPQGCPPTL